MKSTYEKYTEIKSTKIKYNNKVLFESKETEVYSSNEMHAIIIPDEHQNHDFLVIERTIVEQGNRHWITINWESFTPIDGIDFTIECKDGDIKEHYIFDDIEKYEKPNLSKDRKNISIKSAKWIDPFAGVYAVISDTPLENEMLN